MCKELIIASLNSKLENLRSSIIANAEQLAMTYYRDVASRVKTITESRIKIFEEYKKAIDERDCIDHKCYLESQNGSVSQESLNKLREITDKKSRLGAELNKMDGQLSEYGKTTKKYTEEQYVNEAKFAAKKNFDNKVVDMAERLLKKGFTDNLQITSIGFDLKLFDAIIESNGKKVHARSISAAQESNLMKPHFRFIITNAK